MKMKKYILLFVVGALVLAGTCSADGEIFLRSHDGQILSRDYAVVDCIETFKVMYDAGYGRESGRPIEVACDINSLICIVEDAENFTLSPQLAKKYDEQTLQKLVSDCQYISPSLARGYKEALQIHQCNQQNQGILHRLFGKFK